MIKKQYISILTLILFLNIILISASAQQDTTRSVDVDISRPGPEFIIHWRYSDFPNNARADTVVNLIEHAAKNAWEGI